MGKVPVGKTIAYAYNFAFGNILNILGVAWFPYLIIGVAGYFLLVPYFNGLQNFLSTQDMSQLRGSLLLLPVFVVICVIGMSMVVVEVMREALGMDPGRKFFYFSLDKPVWRMIGAYLLVILLLVGLGIAGAIILGILAFIVGMAGENAVLAVSSIGGIVFVLAMVLLAVRLVFLLPAVVVAENHISLKRGYHLTYGNFWRIIAVFLAIVIPIAIVQSVLQIILLGPDFTPFSLMTTGNAEDAAAKLQALESHLGKGLIFFAPIWLLLSIINLGLMSGAGAFAYRALTGSQSTPQK